MITLRAHPEQILPGVVLSLLLMGLPWLARLHLSGPATGCLCVPGFYLLVRSFASRVTVTSTQVAIHGTWWTRRIDRAALIAMTDSPALRWRTADGAIRETWLRMFARSGSGTQGLKRYNADALMQLRRTLHLPRLR